MKKINDNKYIKTLKNIGKSERGRAVLFFAFYFIFFFVLITLIRSGYSSSNDQSNKSINSNYKLNGIVSGNYHFTRDENFNGVITSYVGDKSGNRIEGIMSKDNVFYNYFIYDNINLLRINNKYEVVDSLYLFNDITSDKLIEKILKRATLVSKTEYENGIISYNYSITTSTLDEIVKGVNIDLADDVNSIVLDVNDNREVVAISYDLSSYASYVYNLPTTFNLKITYSSFGKIKSLEIPKN